MAITKNRKNLKKVRTREASQESEDKNKKLEGSPKDSKPPNSNKSITKEGLSGNGFFSKLEYFFKELLPKPVKVKVKVVANKNLKESPRASPNLNKSTPNKVHTLTQQSRPKAIARPFQYTKPVKYEEKRRVAKTVEVVEVIDSRILSKRPILDSVKNINDISFMDRVSLVRYFFAKNSGKLDEKVSREEYINNTKHLNRVYTLSNFLYESAIRNLEYAEHDTIILQVDSFFRDILDDVLASKTLSSFEISIYYENPILTKMKAEPIFLQIKIREL